MEKNDRDYSNEDITVHWKPEKCVHSTICYARLREVFDPIKRPWVNMQGAPTDKIIDIVNQCPTDALTFSWNKDKGKEIKEKPKEKTEEKVASTKIQIMKNGPAIISGEFLVEDIYGVRLPKADKITICRCGHSSNQPFCDGTHFSIDFKEKR